MKKFQLRNIIRESIKGLLTEGPPNSHRRIDIDICDCQPSTDPLCNSFPSQPIHPNAPTNSSLSTAQQGVSSVWGFTCNGGICDLSPGGPHIGKIFSWNWGSVTITAELLGATIPMIGQYFKDMTFSTCPPSSGENREGCGVPQALNYMECCDDPNPNCTPNVLVDNCCEFPDPDWGWNCEQIGDHWKFGHHCVPGTVYNPGQYATQQDCMSVSPCADYLPDFPHDMENPGFESPLTTTPQSMVKPEDDEMRRMQELANIKKNK